MDNCFPGLLQRIRAAHGNLWITQDFVQLCSSTNFLQNINLNLDKAQSITLLTSYSGLLTPDYLLLTTYSLLLTYSILNQGAKHNSIKEGDSGCQRDADCWPGLVCGESTDCRTEDTWFMGPYPDLPAAVAQYKAGTIAAGNSVGLDLPKDYTSSCSDHSKLFLPIDAPPETFARKDVGKWVGYDLTLTDLRCCKHPVTVLSGTSTDKSCTRADIYQCKPPTSPPSPPLPPPPPSCVGDACMLVGHPLIH